MWPISGLGGAFHADSWSRVKYEVSAFTNHDEISYSIEELGDSNFHYHISTHSVWGNPNHWWSCFKRDNSAAPRSLPSFRCQCPSSSRIRGSYRGRSTNSYRFGRGFEFFIERRQRHYDHIDDEILKPLKVSELEIEPNNPETQRNICDDYRLAVKLLPTDSYFYNDAILHITSSNSAVGKNLENLLTTLKEHNANVDSLETCIRTKLDQAFRERKLEYDNPQIVFNILRILRNVWKTGYIKHLDEHPSEALSRSTVLDELSLYKRTDEESALILEPFTVWKERETGEKDKVIDAIRNFAVNPVILSKLELLEISKRTLEVNISDIVKEASKLSKAIEAEAYSKKQKCCPTFFKLVRNYFF
jgi:hypothetical protein